MCGHIKKYFSLFLFLFLLSFTSIAKDKIEILRAGDWAPYHFENENGELTGFLIDIIQNVGEVSNIEVEFINIPSWTRCLIMMKNGDADAFMPLFKTPERENFIYFLENNILFYENDVFVSLKKNPIDFNGNLNNMKEYFIGMVKGYSYGEDFDNADFLKKVEDTNEEQLLKLLLHEDRYPVIVGDERVFTYLAYKKGILQDLYFSKKALVHEPLYIGFSKNKTDKDLIEKFTANLKKFKKSEKYKTILNQYGITLK